MSSCVVYHKLSTTAAARIWVTPARLRNRHPHLEHASRLGGYRTGRPRHRRFSNGGRSTRAAYHRGIGFGLAAESHGDPQMSDSVAIEVNQPRQTVHQLLRHLYRKVKKSPPFSGQIASIGCRREVVLGQAPRLPLEYCVQRSSRLVGPIKPNVVRSPVPRLDSARSPPRLVFPCKLESDRRLFD